MTNITIVGNGYLAASGETKTRLAQIHWQRRELDLILNLYGRMVAQGEWRDYAIDSHKDCAIFSVFRHSSDVPLFRIEKHPALARKQGAYLIKGMSGQILKRGNSLSQALKVLDKKKNHLRLID